MGKFLSRMRTRGSSTGETVQLVEATHSSATPKDSNYGVVQTTDEEPQSHLPQKAMEETDDSVDSAKPADDTRRRIVGRLLFVCAGVTTSLAGGAAQYLGPCIPGFQLNLLRLAAVTCFASPSLIQTKCDVIIQRSEVKWVISVGVFYMALLYVLYTACIVVPIGSASVVVACLVIIFDVIFTFILFRQVAVNLLVASAVAIISVTLVEQPEFIFHTNNTILNNDSLSLKATCLSQCLNETHTLSVKLCSTDNNSSLTSNQTHPYAWNLTDFDVNISGQEQQRHEKVSTYFQAPVITGLTGGYILPLLAALAIAAQDFIINLKMPNVNVGAYALWMPLSAIILSLVLMIALEHLTWPSCWACSLAAVGHAFIAGGDRLLWYLGLQRIRPLEASIVFTPITVLTSTLLQYTVLSTIQPGHQNWQEYLGISLMAVVLLVGPGYSALDDYRARRSGTEP